MSMMLLTGCDSTQCMRDYYTTNQDNLAQIRTLSKTLVDNYAFEKITIKKKSGELEIGFWAEAGAASMYVNSSDLSLIHEFPNSKCSAAVLQTFRTMYNDNTLKEILTLFEAIEPKAIRITHGGVFVALGQPLLSPNVNLNGGILMTFEPGFTDRKIVETIDTNVYLYDTLVY
jgi:hypothetical protein